MDDTQDPPKILANRVIQQMVEHMLANAPVLEAQDFMVIRTTFRSMGGTWVGILEGDKKQLDLLKKTVETWGAMQPPPNKGGFI